MVQIVGYADDVNIMAQSHASSKETFQELKYAEGIGLQVHPRKTQVMITTGRKIRKPKHVEIGKENIEIVNQFKYLGSWITEDNEEMIEVRKRYTLLTKYMLHHTLFLRQP